MKNRKTRMLALVLAVVMAFGLVTPAWAYSTPDFSDLPVDNWAYDPVMRMADQGIIQGTGEGKFSPEMKVSVAQFLTLVGRIVFPNTTVSANDTWYGPYTEAAQANGLLSGSQVDVNQPEAEISRYDMAVILRAAAKKLGKAEVLAQQSQVTDFGLIPNMYTEAVLAVYGMGLIKGDQAGNFNGSNTMMRNETATVIDRLVALKGSDSTSIDPETPSGATPSPSPEASPSPAPEIPSEPVIVTAETWGSILYYPTQGNGSWNEDATTVTSAGIPFKILYTEDGGETSTLMGEGVTTGICSFELEFPVDKTLLDDPNGQFYLSAKFEKDGQIFVTQDLRTDGRKGICEVETYEKGHGSTNSRVMLVPPTGQIWEFELTGNVPNSADLSEFYFGDGSYEYRKITGSCTGFTIQLVYYPDPEIQDRVPTGTRIVLGETKGDENGKFVLPVSMDTLDLVYGENYRIEISGTHQGQYYYSVEQGPLKTLSDLKTNMDAAWWTNLLFDRQ